MTEAYDEGYNAYLTSLSLSDNPYDAECHPFAAPSKEWCEWYNGWDEAYLQFNSRG